MTRIVRFANAGFVLWTVATLSFVIWLWHEGGGGRSDAAVIFALFVIGVPIWAWFLCAVGEDDAASPICSDRDG